MTTRYLSCAETAKLIRVALKKAFPGVKFSVRSSTYSMGASIRVGWTDGPTDKAVDSVVQVYSGAGFDGMIDLKYHKSAWLMPDGSATFAKTTGTAGSMGTVSSAQEMQPSFKAEQVHFGADYVFTNRRYSMPVYAAAVKKLCDDYGQPMPELVDGVCGPYIKSNDWRFADTGQDLSTLVHRALQEVETTA
jgi:hypothetical protein